MSTMPRRSSVLLSSVAVLDADCIAAWSLAVIITVGVVIVC